MRFRGCGLGPGASKSLGFPRGSIYTTIMELSPKRPSPLWFWGPNSIIVVYMDPLDSGVPYVGSGRRVVCVCEYFGF